MKQIENQVSTMSWKFRKEKVFVLIVVEMFNKIKMEI